MLSKRSGFVKALRKEIKSRSIEFSQIEENVNTIYFGGGTPSVLTASHLGSILRDIRKYYPVCDNETNRDNELDSNDEINVGSKPEITLEVNPEDVTPVFMHSVKKAGFNRLSIGIQSFYDAHLKWMNRRHTAAQAIKAFKIARESGFDNISIDLIFGFEGLTTDTWRENIKRAISLAPEHISCYQMTIERKTKLYTQYLKGEYLAINDQFSFCQFSSLQSYLAEAGYFQYEVSSFCKPGLKSRHNSSYWDFTPYFGFGPAAHSFNGRERSWNCKGINSYINGIQNGTRLYKTEAISPKDRFNEFIMVSLRKIEGIDKKRLMAVNNLAELGSDQIEIDISQTEGFGQFITEEFTETLNSFLEQGDLIEESGKIKIPPEKLFLSDGIIRELFI